jgi:molybdenum cofactor biosynthesis protein MoaC
MVNITHKSSSLRKAIASAIVLVSSEQTISAIKENRVPKGDIFSFAKVAALFAVKKTSELIPDCHPLPVEFTAVDFEIQALSIKITVEVHTVYKTGIEVEAMHGAAVAALTIYDMLKPIDNLIEIQKIKLEKKEGGKSGFKNRPLRNIKTAVIVCSDSVFQNKAEDKAGLLAKTKLVNFQLEIHHYEVIPDEANAIRQQVTQQMNEGIQLLVFVGGTGASVKDITPDTIRPLLEIELDGVMEQARRYGQDRMPFAMLSRSVAGFIGQTLVLTLPGSSAGASEYIDALFPQVLHLFDIRNGEKHQ